ncbi:MAG: ATP-binding cassette domain-containing protein [Galbitalea sp.]
MRGKTTAVRILATLLKPDGGTAVVSGFDVVKHPKEVRRRIGLTGQFASVDEDLTGMQNLVMIGELLDLSAAQARARANELLAEFDLLDAAKRLAKTYSGGMRRRLDLSASLIGRPAVVYLDEPTTGLDPAKRDDVWDMIRVLVKQGHHHPAHHPVPRGGRRARQRDHRHRPRQDHRARHPPQGLKRQVGGQTLEVRPNSPADLGRIRELLVKFGTREPSSPPRTCCPFP